VPSPRVGVPIPRLDRFSDGSVKANGFELDGKLHGHWEWFRPDGSLMRSGEFDLGHQVGMWRTWDRAGRLVRETSFGPWAQARAGQRQQDQAGPVGSGTTGPASR
jgi:antitoxin component YwqK of YwqJK toxin-antitoxin module